MAGVRIYHPEIRRATFLVSDPSRFSGRTGIPKTYHLKFDGMGFTEVSPTIWERLRFMASIGVNHGLVFSNPVPNPPTIRIGAGIGEDERMLPQTKALIENAVRDIAPAGTRVTITR